MILGVQMGSVAPRFTFGNYKKHATPPSLWRILTFFHFFHFFDKNVMFFQIHPGQLDFKSEKQGPNEEISKSWKCEKIDFFGRKSPKNEFLKSIYQGIWQKSDKSRFWSSQTALRQFQTWEKKGVWVGGCLKLSISIRNFVYFRFLALSGRSEHSLGR